jgi:site-specific recombinase XerD
VRGTDEYDRVLAGQQQRVVGVPVQRPAVPHQLRHTLATQAINRGMTWRIAA